MRIDIGYPEPTAIWNEEDAKKLVAEVDRYQSRGVRPAVDTETTGLDILNDYPLFWSICFDLGSRYCLPAAYLPIFKPLFEDRKREWWFTNAKYDRHMLANFGIKFRGKSYCTVVSDWLLDDTKQGLYGLKPSVRRHFNISMLEFNQLFGIKRGQKKSIKEVLLDAIQEGSPDRAIAIDYASSDAWHTFKLGNHLEKRLSDLNLWKYMRSLYVPMLDVLWHMERRGIMLSRKRLEELRIPLQEKKDELERRFAELAGAAPNLNSPKQLRELFFGTLGRKPSYWTDGGASGERKPSLKEQQLLDWAAEGDELSQTLMDFRKTAKLISTYIDGLQTWMDTAFRVHTTFNLHRTATGRLSSSDPALQNIPVRGKLGPLFRQCFISPEDKLLICVDYSQLEQAIMAHFCQDPNMLKMVRKGQDIHSASTAIMFDGCTYEDVIEAKKTPDAERTERHRELLAWRKITKNMSFGINYGSGDKLLADNIGVSVPEAKQRRKQYLNRFPAIREYIEKCHQKVREDLFVTTILGRPRRLWGALAGGQFLAEAERRAVNTTIQGSAADVVARAMIRCHKSKELKELDARMLVQVHDELIFEIPKENAQTAMPVIKRLLEDDPSLGLTVPLRADPAMGADWNEAKD